MDDDVTERWLPVVGWEGFYKVSSFGRVQSLARKTPTGTRGGKIMTPEKRPDDHLKVELRSVGRREKFYVHQLVMLAFVGRCPDGLEIRHLNGDATDNHLSNLTHGTRSQNAVDRLMHGRDRNGRKTHCPHGHEYTPENTYVIQKGIRGWRQCRTCSRERGRRRTQARREATLAA